MFCDNKTAARRRYERGALRWLGAYFVVLLCSAWFVRHDGSEKFFLYFWSVIPALPIIGIVLGMARYLREEKDEFQRMRSMQSLLFGTAAFLITVVVNDFLRAFAHSAGLPPFTLFIVFMLGVALGDIMQWMHYRVRADD